MLEELMNNPYAWAILSLLTIISFVYAIFTQYINKAKKLFSYIQNSYTLIKDKKSMFDKLSVLYDGQPIKNLCVSEFTIWNSGNQTINSNDVVTSKELTITVDENNKILDTEILVVTEDTNNFRLEVINDHTVKILFEYADKKDGLVLQIIHTGTKDSISIDCKIKGGLPIKNGLNDSAPRLLVEIIRSKAFVAFSGIFLGLILTLCFLAALFFTVTIFNISLQQAIFSKDAITPFSTQSASIFMTVIMWLYTFVLTSLYFPALKKHFGMGVPKPLR